MPDLVIPVLDEGLGNSAYLVDLGVGPNEWAEATGSPVEAGL